MSFTNQDQIQLKRGGQAAAVMTVQEMRDILALRNQLKKNYMDYETQTIYATEYNSYIRPTKNKEAKNKIPAEPKKPSIKGDPEALKGRINRMREQGYTQTDIHELLNSIYSDYKETLEEIKRNAPKCPFELGDILKSENSQHDFRYFEVKKLNFDPVHGWMADVNFVLSKQGIPVATSSTTIRKMARGGRNSYNGLVLSQQKYSKVTSEEMAILFSRHPYTNIFY